MPDADLSRRILAAVDEGFEAQLHFTEALIQMPSLRGQEAGALACLARGYRAEAALIPEPMGDCLSVAQVGVIWMQVRVAGRPAHAAYASLDFNAIDPDQDVDAARRELETVICETTRQNPHLSNNPPTITYHGFTAPGYVLPEDSDAERALQGAYRAATGRDLAHRVLTGLTNARFFGLYQDTPALVFGPTAEDIHAFDERVEIDSIRRITGVIALFLADWCQLEERRSP